MLRAAFVRWEQYGSLDPQSGDPAGAGLDQWLENTRLADAPTSPPSWLRALLGALGLAWDPVRSGPERSTGRSVNWNPGGWSGPQP